MSSEDLIPPDDAIRAQRWELTKRIVGWWLALVVCFVAMIVNAVTGRFWLAAVFALLFIVCQMRHQDAEAEEYAMDPDP